MPKNAVQKLQEIQKDINTVISLYEIANKTKNNNDKSETSKKQDSKQLPQISTSKYLEAIPQFGKSREEPYKPQVSLLDTFKKASSFFTRPSQGLGEPLLKTKWKTNKPGSAPSFSSEISTTIESDYVRQEISGASSASDRESLGKTKTSYSLSSSDWLSNNVPPIFDVVMTPSKTLETANKILEKNNFKENEEFKETQAVVNCKEKKSEGSFQDEKSHHSLDGKNQTELTEAPKIENSNPAGNSHLNDLIFFLVKKSSTTRIKSQGKGDGTSGRSRSISPAATTSDSCFQSTLPNMSKSAVTAQVHNAKDKSLVHICSTVAVVSKEDQKPDRKPSNSENPKNVKSSEQISIKPKQDDTPLNTKRDDIPIKIKQDDTPLNTKQDDIPIKTKQHDTSIKTKQDDILIKAKQDDGPIENNQPDKETSKTTETKITPAEKKSPILKRVERSVDDNAEHKKNRGNVETKTVHFSEIGDLPTDQKAEKPAREDDDDVELWTKEFSKIIGKSKEKLHKMKVSKELALDIANHFKEKYEDIQKSKADLLEKLQMVEKNSKRLSNEVQEAREWTKMLQKKILGLEESSIQKTEGIEQLKDLKKEILNLKATLHETEKQYRAKLVEKNKKIEEIQLDRLEESKNGSKQQEILAKKLQRLTKEKSELLSKFEELGRELHNSHFKTKTLEENIRLLEEEVQKQKQQLKIKTETLHETNRELEMIRLNCTDLDEQVKVLRKSIEEFDGIQHSLIKQTTEYEQQIKSNQEKIKDLQNENGRLTGELENDKDGLRIKTKIIEDQQQTIRQLKEKLEDAKTLLRKNHSLERMLNTEREEKLELQEAVQRLKWRKDELKKKVKSLESDLLLAPQEVVRDLQKTQVVLHELENQVQTKQKEWELQLHSLMREKQQACSVAEFATRKLMETTTEFHKQSQAYKGLQRLVAGNLAAKERHHLREGNKKAR